MALTTPLTAELIHQTADQLLAEGIRPTQNNVRERLGGGSFTTIAAAMKSWQAEKQETAQLEKITIPDDLSQRLQLLGAEAWETAQTLANERLQKEREALQHKEALMVEELDQYKQTIATLESEQAESLATLDGMTAQLEQVTALTGEQSKQIDELNRANVEQGNKLQSLNEKLSIEREKSATLQEKLDTATVGITGLTGDNATLKANHANALNEIERLKTDLVNAQAQADSVLRLTADLARAQAVADERGERIKQLESQLAQSQAQQPQEQDQPKKRGRKPKNQAVAVETTPTASESE